jgi:hypothetical protein
MFFSIRKNWLIAALFLVPNLALCQFVTVQGTVQDSAGHAYSNGTGVAVVVPQTYNWLLNGTNPVQTPVPIGLDSFGHFSLSIPSTALIQPQSGGPEWQFSFTSQACPQQPIPAAFTMSPMAIASSEDISTQIQAQAALNNCFGGGGGTITNIGTNFPITGGPITATGNIGLTNTCAANQVLQWTGTAWACTTITGTLLQTNGVNNSTQGTLNLASGSNVTLVSSGSTVTIASTGGGGSTTPGGTPTSTQVNVGNTTFGGVSSVASGSAYVSAGASSYPVFQPKPVYDVRDYGLACNGSTNDTAAMVALRAANMQNATVAIPVDATHPGPCELGGINLPFTLDFSGGGAIGLIANPATPGNGALVQASPGTAYTGNSCTATLSSAPTAGNAVLMEIIYEFGSGTVPNLPADSANDSFNVLLQSNLSFQSNSTSWAAAAVAGGSASQAITVTLAGASTHGVCFAQEVSGEGTGITVDPGSNFTYASGSSPYSGPYSVTATLESGDFVLAYGGQGTNNTTCTQGSGFTQPSSTEGNVNGMCLQYQADSSAGSVTATQTTSPNSFSDYWVYNIIGIRPGTSVVHPQAGIIDPDLHQVFVNATGANGAISFFHNLALSRVYPEWWGGSPPASAATNTPAIQAAINASFNNGGTAYNKTLDLGRGIYNINAETQWYNVNGNQASRFQVDCGSAGGINQTTANLRIMDSQSMDYGRFDNCVWSSSATDTQTTADLDIDWNGVITPAGQKPQFLDFYSNSFIGNKLRAIGVLGAKSGGAAQFSNINFYNPEFSGFTQAAYQIGTPTVNADNAIENFIWGGDMQGNNDYGVAVYGGNIEVIGTSMENGFSSTTNEGAQTGYDMYCAFNQGPCVMQWVRSESEHLAACETCVVEHSYTIDQAAFPTPGGSDPVGAIVDGHNEGIVWDGRYYIVTGDNGPFGGAGTPSAPLTASGGSSTTIVDTNETVAGSVTTGTATGVTTVTQTGTGSTGTLLNFPTSNGTVPGSRGVTLCDGLETMTQSSSGVTGVLQFPTPNNSGTPLMMNDFSGTALGTSGLTWTGGTSGCVWTQTAGPTFSATTMLITAATGSPNSSGTWTSGGFTFTPTASPVAQANWTTNQFVGMATAVTGGTNQGCYGVVTANNAQTVTLSAGWTTQYNLLACSAPAALSSFIVEPNWGSAATLYSCATGSTSACASTGMTLALVTDDGIGTCNGCVSAGIQADDVSVPGLRWKISQSGNTTLKSVTVTPSLWLDSASDPQTCCALDRDWDVRRAQTLQIPGVGTYYENWTLPSLTGVPYTGPFGDNVGARAYVFTTGTVGSSPNQSSNDTWVGGRSDPSCGTDITRCHLETSQSIGPKAALGLNQNGGNYTFVAGLSTGNGTPGTFNWYCGATGSSGTSVNGGGSSPSYCMTLGVNGLVLSSISASTSPICPNGTGGAFTIIGCSGGGGLSGMTASQVPIAATSTTITSSKALAGSGAGITTGPASGVVSGDFTQFTGTGGQVSDSGISVTAGADTVLGNPTGSSATAGYTTNPIVGTMTALTQFSVGAPTSITCPSGGSCFTAGEASTSGFAGASSTDAIDFDGLSTVVSLNGGSPYIPAMLYPLAGGSSTTSVASTLATLDQTGVSTANSGTPQNVLAATPAAGHYRIFVYVDQSAGCSSLGSGALTVSVAWTDATHARVSGNQTLTVATVDTGTGDWVQITQDLWATSASAITVTDTYTACTTGTWTYDQHAVVERVE